MKQIQVHCRSIEMTTMAHTEEKAQVLLGKLCCCQETLPSIGEQLLPAWRAAFTHNVASQLTISRVLSIGISTSCTSPVFRFAGYSYVQVTAVKILADLGAAAWGGHNSPFPFPHPFPSFPLSSHPFFTLPLPLSHPSFPSFSTSSTVPSRPFPFSYPPFSPARVSRKTL